MKIYLDTCVWCRSFDVPSEKTLKETDAFFKILEKTFGGDVRIAGSVVLEVEAGKIEIAEKRSAVTKLIEIFTSERVYDIEEAKQRDIKESVALKLPDASHIACAIRGKCKYFITCDDEIIHKKREIEHRYGIKVRSPTEFLEEMKWQQKSRK